MRLLRFGLPLLLFVLVLVFLGVGLERDPRHIPSPLVGKPLPAFTLPALGDAATNVSNATLAGRPFLLNVWASWCLACRDEHPLLVEFAARSSTPLIGLNYKDEAPAAQAWLERHGNPYRLSIADPEGRLGLDLGVYGVPETFLVDANGIIRYKHTGPLTAAAMTGVIAPAIAALGTPP